MKKPLAAAVLALHLVACKPGVFPSLSQIEQVVLTDLEAGKNLEQIEADVKAITPAGADVVTLVDDALIVLSDLGVIPSANLASAQAMHAVLQPMHAASKLK